MTRQEQLTWPQTIGIYSGVVLLGIAMLAGWTSWVIRNLDLTCAGAAAYQLWLIDRWMAKEVD